ncbi:MAG TPA: hypothetical protein VK698_09045 [Kofleriaceae bacterium]|nr:hypothetical protein [Kofleriaceae bacterium]
MSIRRFALVLGALAAASAAGQGCSCSGQRFERRYPQPTIEALLAHVQKSGEQARSYVAESTMDYWVGNQRIRATVYAMGERGAHVRFNAINPATDTTAADLACNGQGFAFLDYEHNCQLSGVCDRRAIAQLLRVSMEPDDFLLLSVGSVPIIPQPTGTVRWDEKRGAEVVELVSPDRAWRQTLVLDGRGGAGEWDVLESVVVDAQGAVDWKLANKDFRAVTASDGKVFRVPDASHFEQPRQKADLQVRWKDRKLNMELDRAKFELALPAGLARCGAKKPAAK